MLNVLAVIIDLALVAVSVYTIVYVMKIRKGGE